jgi:hypothetical protein
MMVDPTGFEPVTFGVNSIEVTVYLHGPLDNLRKIKTPISTKEIRGNFI